MVKRGTAADSGRVSDDESVVGRLIRSTLGPTLLAVGLALVSSPLVAAALVAESASPRAGTESYDGPPPIDFANAVPIALVAVVTAGLIGGMVGGRVVRQAPLLGLLAAVAVAWPVAIATLPIVPTLQGEPYATGFFCFDVCTPEIVSGQPLSGLAAYAQSVFAGIVFILWPAIAIGFAIAARAAWRAGNARLAATLGLAAYGTINLVSAVGSSGNVLPFLCLVIGAVIWVAPYWARWERVRPPSTTVQAARDVQFAPAMVSISPLRRRVRPIRSSFNRRRHPLHAAHETEPLVPPSATLEALEGLHAAGSLNDAEFESWKRYFGSKGG